MLINGKRWLAVIKVDMCATLRKVKSCAVNLCANRNLISSSFSETQIGLASVCPVVSSLWPLCKWQAPALITRHLSEPFAAIDTRIVGQLAVKPNTTLHWLSNERIFPFLSLLPFLKLYFTSQAKHRIQLNLKGVWKKYIYTGTRNLHKQTLNRRGIWYNMWVKLQWDEHTAKMRLKLHCCD